MGAYNKIDKYGNFIQLIFFILVFALPRIFQTEKITIIGLLVISQLILGKFYPNSLKFWLWYILTFLFTLFSGLVQVNDFNEISNGIRIYLFFPLIIGFLLLGISPPKLEDLLFRSAIIAILITCVFAINSLFAGLGFISVNWNNLIYTKEPSIGIHDGYFHIVNTPLSYLLFLVPFYYANIKEHLDYKKWSFYVLIFVFLVCIISSRRILLLPFIILYIYNIKHMKLPTVILGSLFVLLIYFGYIDSLFIETFLERMSDALNERGDSLVRDEQKQMFIRYILDKPITGYGLGAYMQDYYRNVDFKSAYEATLYYLIFVMGIPIVITFFIFYYSLFRNVWKNITYSFKYRQGLVLGTGCLLIASYTNPYWMSSFDFILPFVLLLKSSR